MDTVLDILQILLPNLIVGGIAIFVVLRMKNKYKKGTLGKKETQVAQNLLDSLIPLGMISGLIIAILLNIYFPISLLTAISWGPGIGLLLGYFAYEVYSKKEDSYS